MINKKNSILCLFITFLSIHINAQQTPHYTQYLYNMEVVNPAAVGSRSDLNVSVLSRHQWSGVEGAPTTQTFSLNGRTNKGFAIGTTIIYDQIGLTKNTNINIDASFTLTTSKYGRLALGLKGGISYFNNNFAQGITPDKDVYASNSGNYPNIGFGALYYNKKYFIGVSLPYILEISQFNIEENAGLTGVPDNLNYFISGGYKFQLTQDIKFKPTTLIKYNSKLPVSVDINANFLYQDYLEAGLSYRYDDSISALLAFTISEKIRIGYSYDRQLTNFGTNLNSHEIVLHMDLNLKRKGRWLEDSSCYF